MRGSGRAGLWDWKSGKQLAVFRGDPFLHAAKFVTFSPDGKLLAVGGDSEIVTFLDATSVREIGNIGSEYGDDINCAAFSPNGKYLATGYEYDRIKLWDVKTQAVSSEFAGHRERVNGIAFAPTGDLFATGSDDETVRVWSIETGQESKLFNLDVDPQVSDRVWSVAFSPDGYVGRLDRYPKIVFIRSGNDWVGAFTKTGTRWHRHRGSSQKQDTDHLSHAAVVAAVQADFGRVEHLASGTGWHVDPPELDT